MEFIKQMKKREFIEMAIKAAIALCAGIIAIILMEAMIYGIRLHAIETKSANRTMNSATSIAYCIKKGEDQYFVLCNNPGETIEWTAKGSNNGTINNLETKAQCEKLSAKKIIYGAPSAFVFSITPTHYAVMGGFLLAIIGYFSYRFIKLNFEYKKVEKEYITTGTIEITSL